MTYSDILPYFEKLPAHAVVTDRSGNVLWNNRAAQEFPCILVPGLNIRHYWNGFTEPFLSELAAGGAASFSFAPSDRHTVQAFCQPLEDGTLLWQWFLERPLPFTAEEDRTLSQRLVAHINEATAEISRQLPTIETALYESGYREEYLNFQIVQQQCDVLRRNTINARIYTAFCGGEFSVGVHEFSPAKELTELDFALQNIFETTDPPFQFTISEEAAEVLLCCEERLWLIALFNLMCNAHDYAPQDTPIEVRLSCTDKHLLAAVVDQGGGVDHDTQLAVRLGNPLAPTARHPNRLGLGLQVAHRIAKQMDGKLWFESNGKDRSAVVLAVPYTPNDPPTGAPVSVMARWASDQLSPFYAFFYPIPTIHR